jgi:ribosome recycling factor
MINEVMATAKSNMEKALEAYKNELSKLRTGRANPGILDSVMVDYYGTPTPISQLANVNAPEARTLAIQPWDQSALSEIEKAILTSDLGLTPQNDGKMIRLPMPPMTEEVRKQTVKQAGKIAEDGKIGIRNVRRAAMDDIKKGVKDKELTEDDQKRASDQIQKLTDQYIDQVDSILDVKSKDILSV